MMFSDIRRRCRLQNDGKSPRSPPRQSRSTMASSSLLRKWQTIAIVLCLVVLAHDVNSRLGVDARVSSSREKRTQEHKHVMFVSNAIEVHATPLLRMADYMVHNTKHRITFATHDSGQKWVKETGAEFLSAGAFPLTQDEFRSTLHKIATDVSVFRGVLSVFNEVYLPAARPLFDALVAAIQHDPPDIVVFDVGTIGAQYLVENMSLPYIVNSPTLIFNLNGDPSYVPSWGTGVSIHMSLWSRCMNVLFPRLLSVALTPPFMQVNKQRWELGLPPYRSQHEVLRHSRMLLNTAFGLEYPRPLNPLIDLVGPILPSTDLASSAHAAADSDPNLIYISFGPLVYIEPWQVTRLLNGLKQYHILWSISLDQRDVFPSSVPSSVRIKSLSTSTHYKMLAHPAVRVVISHCGLAAAQEVIYFRKPLLCIPFMMDQPDVASRIVDAGVGLALDKSAFTHQQVRDAIHRLSSNASFGQRATALGDVLKRSNGAKQAAQIIETTMTVGWEHLKSTSVVAPWHKTMMCDVWAVYVSIVFILVALTQVILLSLYYLIVSKMQSILTWLHSMFNNLPPEDVKNQE